MGTLMNEIQVWLENPADYEQGLALYEKYCVPAKYPRLLRTLQHGPSDYNWSALKESLDEVKEKAGVVVPGFERKVAISPTMVKTVKLPPASPSLKYGLGTDSPAEVLEKDEQWRRLYKEASHLQSQLPHFSSNETRKEAAFTILQNFDQIQVLWEELEHYQQHGSWIPVPALVGDPPATPTEPTPEAAGPPIARTSDESLISGPDGLGPDSVALMRKLTNLRSSVSKHKDNEKRQADVQTWREEIAKLEEKLGLNGKG